MLHICILVLRQARLGGPRGQPPRVRQQMATFADYAAAVASDHNLSGVSSLAELHTRLTELSTVQAAADSEGSAFRQLTFPTGDGEANPNPVFRPNPFRKSMSQDGVRLTAHYRYAVKSEEDVIAALEESCAKEPSVVLPPTEAEAAAGGGGSLGGLFQGGFSCVGNLQYLQKHKIMAVVNTAKALGSYFRKFDGMVARAKVRLLSHISTICGMHSRSCVLCAVAAV
jgi:hypothetical protein